MAGVGRTTRIIFNVAAVLSLLLFVTTVLGVFLPHVQLGRRCSAGFDDLDLICWTNSPRGKPSHIWDPRALQRDRVLNLGAFRVTIQEFRYTPASPVWLYLPHDRDTGGGEQLVITRRYEFRNAAVALIPLSGTTPILWVVAFARRDRRWKARLESGLCPVCGYDLRATSERCPECGAVPHAVAARPTGA
jgi:hypothetical protein